MSVSLSELLVAVVLLPFLWVLLDWILEGLKALGATRQLRSGIRHCHLCGVTYQVEEDSKVTTCPECAAKNNRVGPRRLG